MIFTTTKHGGLISTKILGGRLSQCSVHNSESGCRGDITGAASHCGVKIINDVRSGANSNPTNQTAAVERGWGDTNFNCDDPSDL